MPIIRPQHKWKDADFQLQQAWPDDVTVQWGSSGLVVSRESENPSYTTAFFEVFLENKYSAGGFIRGEGASLDQAEENAFEKFKRRSACSHLWGREKYINSGQFCRHCRAFRSRVVQPIAILEKWNKPISGSQEMLLEMKDELGDTDHLTPGSRTTARSYHLRRKFFGLRK